MIAKTSGISEVIGALKELTEDPTVPRNVKNRVEITMKVLQEGGDELIRISKALHEIEEIGEDTNMQGFTRTQILHIMSMLTSLEG